MTRRALLLLGLGAVLFALPAAPCAAAGKFRLRSVQADFTQEKHLKILARPLVSTGAFLFQAPQSLRWEYKQPVRSILLMHGGTLRKLIERDGRMQEDQGMPLDAMQVVMTEISSWLDGRFTDNELFKVSFPDRTTVLLVPKDQAFSGMIAQIELKLGEQEGLVDRVTITEGPDSSTVMQFTNRTLNQPVPEALFLNP